MEKEDVFECEEKWIIGGKKATFPKIETEGTGHGILQGKDASVYLIVTGKGLTFVAVPVMKQKKKKVKPYWGIISWKTGNGTNCDSLMPPKKVAAYTKIDLTWGVFKEIQKQIERG